MSKAPVPKRPSTRASFLGDIKPTMQPANNMSAIKTADMTFKMSPAWHSRFKATAAMHGMSMKDLLVASFQAWEDNQREK